MLVFAVAYNYLPADRAQLFLLPQDMREWLPEGHLAYFVVDVVGAVDTSALHAGRANNGPGRPAYDPEVLLALLVYAYCCGVRSSRKIERLCQSDVAYRVITANRPPDHTTVARFRQGYDPLVRRLFTDVLALCANAGLAKVGVVAIDGTKVSANASPAASVDLARLGALEAKVAEIFAEAEGADAAEDRLFGGGCDDELPPGLAGRGSRAARLAEARRQLEEAKAAQAAKRSEAARRADAAEEEARAKGRARGARPLPGGRWPGPRQPWGASGPGRSSARRPGGALRPQRATPGSAAPRPASSGRRPWSAARGAKPPAYLGRPSYGGEPKANTTDPDSRTMKVRGGYLQGYNAQVAVNELGVVLAWGLSQDANDMAQLRAVLGQVEDNLRAVGVGAGVGAVLADAGYWTEENGTWAEAHNATGEGPTVLIATSKSWKLRHKARSGGYTSGPPPQGASAAQAMEHRLCSEEGMKLYSKRSVTVEPVFGQQKELRGFRRFARRRLGAAAAEWGLMSTAHNILKLFNAKSLAGT